MPQKLSPCYGEDHGNAKLTDKKVREIREAYADEVSIRLLAKLYRVSRRTIQLVVTRKTWTHVP